MIIVSITLFVSFINLTHGQTIDDVSMHSNPICLLAKLTNINNKFISVYLNTDSTSIECSINFPKRIRNEFLSSIGIQKTNRNKHLNRIVFRFSNITQINQSDSVFLLKPIITILLKGHSQSLSIINTKLLIRKQNILFYFETPEQYWILLNCFRNEIFMRSSSLRLNEAIAQTMKKRWFIFILLPNYNNFDRLFNN